MQRFAVEAFRGVNLLRDPRRIADDELVMAKNVIPVRPGRIGKRPGASIVDLNYGGLGTLYPLSGIVSQYLPSTSAVLAANSSNKPLGSSTKLVSIPQGSTILDLGLLCRRPLFLQMAVSGVNSVLCMPGYPYQHTGVLLQDLGAGITAAAKDFDKTAPNLVPFGGCAYRSRFVYWNFGPGYESYIIFSDNFLPFQITNPSGGTVDALSSNGRAFQIGSASDGDRIVACVPIMLSAVGDPTQSALLILKEKSAWLLTGEPNQTTDGGSVPFLNDVDIKRIAYNCGCVAPETVATTPYGTFWVGPDDVWFFQLGAGLPVRVGTKIRPAIQRTPPGQRYRMSGAYFNGFYRFTCAGEGQQLGIADPLQDQWWLDLRDGPPQGDPGGTESHESASWWGPQQYTSCTGYLTNSLMDIVAGAASGNMRLQDNTDSFIGTLPDLQNGSLAVVAGAASAANNGVFQIAANVITSIGNVTSIDVINPSAVVPDANNDSISLLIYGNVPGCFLLMLDDRPGQDASLYSVTRGLISDGTTKLVLMLADASSGPRDITFDQFGSILQQFVGGQEIQMEIRTKQYDFGAPAFQKLYDGLLVDVWCGESFGLQVDAWVDGGLSTDTASRYVQQFGFVSDIQPLDAVSAADVPQGVAIRPTAGVRNVGNVVQLRLYDTPGCWVGVDNSSFVFTYGGVSKTATLTAGYYQTALVLAQALAAAMNTAAGASVFTASYSGGVGANIRITSSGSTWAPVPTNNATTKKLLDQLGYDPTAAYSAAASQTAANSVYQQDATAWEFAGFAIDYDIFPRDPV